MKPFLVLFILFFGASTCYADEVQETYQKGIEALRAEDYTSAIGTFERILTLYPNPSHLYNLMGISYMKAGESNEKAIEAFNQAIVMDPKNVEAYYNLASLYAGPAGDPTKAVEYFQKTIDVNPNYSKAYFGLGWFTLTQKEDPEKALAYFQKTLEKFPKFAEAQYGVGLSYMQMGKSYLALGSVSELRMLGRNDLAITLEDMMKQNEVPGSAAPTQGEGGQAAGTAQNDDALNPLEEALAP